MNQTISLLRRLGGQPGRPLGLPVATFCELMFHCDPEDDPSLTVRVTQIDHYKEKVFAVSNILISPRSQTDLSWPGELRARVSARQCILWRGTMGATP